MAYDIVVKPIVFIDADEAIIFYKKVSGKLATRFYESFLKSIEEIRQSPHNYSYVYKPVRRHIIKDFPYKIFYIVAGEKIIVIGVAHAKRSNRYIKSKLKYR